MRACVHYFARACAQPYIKHFDEVVVSPYFAFRDRRMAQLSAPDVNGIPWLLEGDLLIAGFPDVTSRRVSSRFYH